MKSKTVNLDIRFHNKEALYKFVSDCVGLLLGTTNLSICEKSLTLSVGCDEEQSAEIFNNVFGDWITEQLFKNEICIAAKRIQPDLCNEELEIVCVGSLNVLSNKLVALQDIMGWAVKKFTKNNKKMSLSTFIKMNTVDIRKDIKHCLLSKEYNEYLPLFIFSVVDLRNETNPQFFRNILKHKLLAYGDAINVEHTETIHIIKQGEGFRASTSTSYLDSESVEWMDINGNGSPMSPEEFISFAVLIYNPATIVLYPFEETERLKKFVNEHRVFFGKVRVELWKKRNKT